MEDNKYLLTARQYNDLYCRAFSRLEDIARAAEQAMKELEELQLSMGDSAPVLMATPPRKRREK